MQSPLFSQSNVDQKVKPTKKSVVDPSDESEGDLYFYKKSSLLSEGKAGHKIGPLDLIDPESDADHEIHLVDKSAASSSYEQNPANKSAASYSDEEDPADKSAAFSGNDDDQHDPADKSAASSGNDDDDPADKSAAFSRNDDDQHDSTDKETASDSSKTALINDMTSCSSKKIRNRNLLTATGSLLFHRQESQNRKEKEKAEEIERREQRFEEEKNTK